MSVSRAWAARLAWCAALALQACTQPLNSTMPSEPAQPRDSAAACDAAAAQFAVGQQPLPSLATTARRQAGATTVRVIGHNEMVTKEYLPTRLNLHLDARGNVERVSCG
ncbi:I78 family peptidase inhibitor [Ramlibacter rhizophilus]|uniref:Peptidase inhibitor I78 family protein n=1 Tax=Ramlibacter rhizophilus TaxID=1781167 RepID=A0A4Z0BCA0_9BURK|nr:I78 family peptidase inhibitor [Ramlibacter rhizophilus]TFY96866.1 hypothetical protein EZ242_19525 [Ramlibacter rhizophilus]